MHRADRYVASLFLTAVPTAPVAILAATPRQEGRAYDKEHKDYHRWDDKENEAWRRFLAEKHREDHEFTEAGKKEQSEYWNWRHSRDKPRPRQRTPERCDPNRKTSRSHRLTFCCANRDPNKTG
jgi:hypothetical protein